MAQPPQLVEYRVEALTSNELHRVIRGPVLFADGEDWHDIGVMQVGRRAGLAAETGELGRVEPAVRREHLERDVPAERFLDCLVDDSHPATAEYPQDSEIPEPFDRGGLRPWMSIGRTEMRNPGCPPAA